MTADDIATFVAARGKPSAVSLDHETHIFHFAEDGDWEECDLLFVNKNGHHFRCIRKNGQWHQIATWNGMFEYADWMDKAKLARPTARSLIMMSSAGPQGKQTFESLALLPKEACAERSGRKCVWRSFIAEVRFDRDTDQFTLSLEGKRESFGGKLWESLAGARWAGVQTLGLMMPVEVLKTRHQPVIVEDKFETADANPLWGSF